MDKRLIDHTPSSSPTKGKEYQELLNDPAKWFSDREEEAVKRKEQKKMRDYEKWNKQFTAKALARAEANQEKKAKKTKMKEAVKLTGEQVKNPEAFEREFQRGDTFKEMKEGTRQTTTGKKLESYKNKGAAPIREGRKQRGED